MRPSKSTASGSRGHPHHALLNARGSGAYDRMIALAEQCMADYDEDGWTGDTWLNPDGIAYGSGGNA